MHYQRFSNFGYSFNLYDIISYSSFNVRYPLFLLYDIIISVYIFLMIFYKVESRYFKPHFSDNPPILKTVLNKYRFFKLKNRGKIKKAFVKNEQLLL